MLIILVLFIRDGFMNTNDLDAVWAREERGLRVRGLAAVRTPEWDAAAPQRATVSFVAAGIVAIVVLFIFAQLQSGPTSPTGLSTLTINGRPATPEEQQQFEKSLQQPSQANPQGPSSQ